MKKIILSQILAFGLLLSCISMPLQASSWSDWAMQGLKRGASSFKAIGSNLYSYTPQWVTTLLNRLSDNQKLILMTALAGFLGYGFYKYRKNREPSLSNAAQKIASQLQFKNVVSNDLSADNNLNNMTIFFKAEKDEWDVLNNAGENASSVKCELFMKYIYPILIQINKDSFSETDKMLGQEGNEDENFDTFLLAMKTAFSKTAFKDNETLKKIVRTYVMDCKGGTLEALEKFYQFYPIGGVDQFSIPHISNVAIFLKNEDNEWPHLKKINQDPKWIKCELFKRNVLPIIKMGQINQNLGVFPLKDLIETVQMYHQTDLKKSKEDYMTKLHIYMQQCE